jgi:hypothetical protein
LRRRIGAIKLPFKRDGWRVKAKKVPFEEKPIREEVPKPKDPVTYQYENRVMRKRTLLGLLLLTSSVVSSVLFSIIYRYYLNCSSIPYSSTNPSVDYFLLIVDWKEIIEDTIIYLFYENPAEYPAL